MATTPRNIRFDDDLYKEIQAISKRPLTASYHIQEACRQYMETKTQPVKSVKPEKPSGLIDEPVKALDDVVFDQIWNLYGKKGNKKTSRNKLSKLNDTDRALLLNNIHDYVLSTPDKQYRKNLETYINQECWNDEVIPHAENRPNGYSATNRLSAVDRVRARTETNRAARANNRDSVADVGGCVREHPSNAIRGSDAGSMDNAIEGSYTVTDQGRAEQDSQS